MKRKKRQLLRATLHGKPLNPSIYLAASELEGDLTLTIKSVRRDTVETDSGKHSAPIIRLEETDKLWILTTRENEDAICRLHGVKVENWPGKRVTVYPCPGVYFGEQGVAIRVRPDVPAGGNGTLPVKARLIRAVREWTGLNDAGDLGTALHQIKPRAGVTNESSTEADIETMLAWVKDRYAEGADFQHVLGGGEIDIDAVMERAKKTDDSEPF